MTPSSRQRKLLAIMALACHGTGWRPAISEGALALRNRIMAAKTLMPTEEINFFIRKTVAAMGASLTSSPGIVVRTAHGVGT